MQMKNEIIKTNTLWYKISAFFRKYFGKKKDNIIVKEKIEYANEKMNFKDSINIRDEEKEKIIRLQIQLRNKQITEDELSKEDIKKISSLYDEQIEDLENKIKNNRALLEKYKKEAEGEE